MFIVEVMGHKVGWLTLYAGLAGGADVILLPEIPYDIDSVVAELNKREKIRQEVFYYSRGGRRHIERKEAR